MKTNYPYLQSARAIHANTAVIYYPFFTNSDPVYNCYYNHYDPVKGYLFPYHQRAYISCSSKEAASLFIILFHIFRRGGSKYILCRY
jgi:hypothetical protein